jgi:hypothetical protein
MALFTTPEAGFGAFTIFLAVSKSLTFKTAQWVWYKDNNFHVVKSDFNIFGENRHSKS